VVTTVSASIGGIDYGRHTQQLVEVPLVWDGQLSIYGEVQPMPVQAQVNEPTQLPTDPPSQPEPEPVVSQAPPETGSAEATICGIWATVSCAYILKVARCESGSDYYDDSGGYYIGTFQLDPNLHGGRFLAHGWDIWTDGQDVYKNSMVAYELYLDNGMAPWPVCRYA